MDSHIFCDGITNSQLPPLTEAPASDCGQFLNSCPSAIASSFPVEQHQPNWSTSVILEQCQSFYLIQETSTKIYYLCEVETRLPLLKTDQWAEAYRSWLTLRHQASALDPAVETLSIETLHDWVSQNQDNAYFGQLLYSCDRQFQGTLQYHIRLSETHSIRWAPTVNQTVCLGKLTLDVLSQRRHRSAKWIEKRSSSSMADTLHQSIQRLHQHAQYDLYRFNSEHWARLTTTGQSCSFQKDDLYAYWLSQDQSYTSEDRLDPDIWEENLEAQVLLMMAITP
jgi:hypothetical protein